MAQDSTLFTNPGAYGGAVPHARVADPGRAVQALSNLAGTWADVAAKFYEADQTDRILQARVLMGERFSQLETRLQETTSISEAAKLAEEGGASIQEEALKLAGGPDGEDGSPLTTERIGLYFQLASAKFTADAKRDVLGRQVKAHVVGLQKRHDQYLFSAMNNPDINMEEEIAQYGADLDASAAAGFIHEEDALKEKARFAQEVAYNRASVLVTAQPVQALAMLTASEDGQPAYFKDMDGDQRRSLIVGALNGLGSAEKREKAALKSREDEAAMDLWDKYAEGTLTMEQVRANRESLSKTDFKELVKLAESDGTTVQDDPAATAQLLASIYAPGADRTAVRQEILHAHAARRISGATASSYLSKNQELLKSNGLKSPIAAGFDYVRRSLDVSAIPGAKVINVRLMAEALNEYEHWAAQHPAATQAEVDEFSRNTVEKYALVDLSEQLVILAPQVGLPVSSKVVQADVDKRIAEVKGQYDANAISDEEFRSQMDLLTRLQTAVQARDARLREVKRGR